MRFLTRLVADANNGFAIPLSVNWHVLGYGAAIALLAGVCFGLAPALQSTSGPANERLKEYGRGAVASRRRISITNALVVAQIGLSLLLTVGAGLFLRTLWNLQSVPLGYPRDNLLLLQIDSTSAGYQGNRQATLYHDLAEKVRQVPGVRAVSYSDRGLFAGFEGALPVVKADGFTPRTEADRGTTGDSVGPGYFSTLGIPILLGREFSARDITPHARVCVINQAFARHFFRGANPIGKHVTTVLSDDAGNDSQRTLEVIGVVADARVGSLRGAIDPKLYLAGGGNWLEVRTNTNPSHLLSSLRQAVLLMDSNLTIQSSETLTQALETRTAQTRLVAQLATLFGFLALALAGTGVYGMLSYSVARRANEIGIRVALGADRVSIVTMVLKQSAALTALGLSIGLLVAAAAARLLAAQIYEPGSSGPRWSLAQYEKVDSATRLFGLHAMDPVTILSAITMLAAI